MRKIYIVFSLLCLMTLIYFEFFKKENKISKKEDIFVSLDADIRLEISNLIFKKVFNGKIAYNKPNNTSLFFQEKEEYIEMGSNKEYFWYYNNKENILYYGNVSNVHNILKEVFNPINIIEIIFPRYINYVENEVLEDTLIGDYGALLTRKIIIKNYKIIEQKVYNQKKELVYTIKVYNYYKNIPTNLVLSYTKENYNINIKLNNINISKSITNSFVIPFKKYKKTELLSP